MPWSMFPYSIKMCVGEAREERKLFRAYFLGNVTALKIKQTSPLYALVYTCFLCIKGTMPEYKSCWNTQARAMPPFWQSHFLNGEFKKGSQNYKSHKGPSTYHRKEKECHCKQSHANLPSAIWKQKTKKNPWVHFGIILDLVTPTFFPPSLGILGAINCGNLKVNIEWWPWIWEVTEKQMLLPTKKITR